jgi:hypothetical protein
VALDATSNHTSTSGKELISVTGNSLTLEYGDADAGGPRVYLVEPTGTNANHLFQLQGQEFTFDVELSTMHCGFNAALYFVGMNSNKGGAESGTNYCDAQAVDGTFCSEMDLWEANTEAQQYTTHACIDVCGSFTEDEPQCKSSGSPSTVCDQSGCGLNPFRYGPGTTYNAEFNNNAWYGKGSSFELDSTKLFTVVTQFHVSNGNVDDLMNITRFYLQNGKRIDLPTLYVLPPKDGQHMGPFIEPAITSAYCTDIYDRWDGNAKLEPLAQMGNNMKKGMVLTMSSWYSEETYVNGKPEGSQTGMSWLDGTNNWGKYIKAGPCNATTTDSGGPYYATFSDIRIGEIGSTVPNAPPAPPQPAPSPSPSLNHKCCYGGCSSGNCADSGFCAQSKSNCEGNCNGAWCGKKKSVNSYTKA